MIKKIFILFIFTSLFLIQCQTSEEKVIMEKNKQHVVHFYNDVLNKGDMELLNNIMSEDFIDHNAPPEQPQGIQGFKQFLKMITTAFPDLKIIIEDIFAEGNKVIARLTITGTHTGFLGSIPPSNKIAKWTGIDILEIKNDKIVGRWNERNLLSLMKQIGAVPDNLNF